MNNTSHAERPICQILTVDTQPMVRNGIRYMLESKIEPYIFQIAEAGNVSDAIRKLSIRIYQIVLLEYELPEEQGPSLAHQIFQIQPDTRIICMSARTDLTNIQSMIQAGASGYISKTVRTDELITAISEILNGRTYYSSQMANRLLQEGYPIFKPRNKILHKLSARETEVLKLIAHAKTNKEVAKELFLGERTIETHRKNLILKLGAKNTAGALKAAYELKILP